MCIGAEKPLNLGALTGLAIRATRLPDLRTTACLAPAAQPTLPGSVSCRLSSPLLCSTG